VCLVARLDEIAVDARTQRLKLCSHREVWTRGAECWSRPICRGSVGVGDVVDLRRIAVMAESFMAAVGIYV
jgi:hypothetical protein